ncbi:2-oxoglutarate synthase subunit alpha [Campylobacter geochelonis]|uniref:2-oxoglutarate synthase subunit alpha n=1 Tax=Campylobacter geochelonis TaxID=1780362 RepID=UPI000770792E|nr:2-oxoglutarate synthase subunit alpha [Campylobacter geochelonis]CZE48004.1 2-oxoglutarate-acceptor oxidoreductase subunit OorA [Campylobacter geochelonis]
MREVISTGNILAAQAAVECGCNFFGGYPITPSSEVAHEMSVLLPKNGGRFIQMEDEISGICVALGASMSGAKALTASSGPGISLKAEQIGLGFIAEVPLVIINVMRGGPSTGLPTRVAQGDIMQAKNPTHGDFQSIALCPGTLEEAYSETVRAFNLAEKFMTPVFVLLDETLGHMQAKAMLPEIKDLEIVKRREFSGDPKEYKPYEAKADEPATLNPFFKGYKYHITGLHHGPTGFPTENGEMVGYNMKRLMDKINNHKDEIIEVDEYMLDDAEICIIAYGSVNLSARNAVDKLRKDGIKVGLFRPKTLWPSPEKELKEIGKRFKKILVVELNMGQYYYEIERTMLRDDLKTLFKANGRPISPAEIIEKVKEF